MPAPKAYAYSKSYSSKAHHFCVDSLAPRCGATIRIYAGCNASRVSLWVDRIAPRIRDTIRPKHLVRWLLLELQGHKLPTRLVTHKCRTDFGIEKRHEGVVAIEYGAN